MNISKEELLRRYLAQEIVWEENKNPLFPLKAIVNGKKLLLRINDFPEEQLYTVFEEGGSIGHLDEFPKGWSTT